MINKLACLSIALLASSAAMAASGESSDPASELPVTQYEYGMELDIQKVISVTPKPDTCDVVPATMIYVDSHGDTQRLDYRAMGNCLGG
ncbi:DUF2790 domain-containing protein [Zestomonas carbonaria]|uniref:DUF2790 domain-containing protein n=1 Tax=Zestomonas carbonaria TaxID=2762745 RepID=A0A7U7ERP3_9GAMM|nr:DUF2790 domain-containing protein [Pseudomonas carbonaria]CAD5109845.1 hypothetical protein PSEWESI4_04159 [Pseudomonas carbonaria]